MQTKTTDPIFSETPTHTSENSGNFAAGLFLGFVTGVAGIALFRTKEGQEIWEKVKSELRTSFEEYQSGLQNVLEDVEKKEKKLATEEKNLIDSAKKKFPKFQMHHPKS